MHDVKIIDVKELSDTQVGYLVECCGEEMTRSWHTCHVDAADHDETLEAHKKRVADLHEKKQAWRRKITGAK